MILHLVSKSPTQNDALDRCLSVINDQDQLLLLQEGVYAGIQHSDSLKKISTVKITVFALNDDVCARGLTNHWDSVIECIDYATFVTLTEKASKVISWF